MTHREAKSLSRTIEQDAPACRVTGLRVYRTGRHADYEIDVTDSQTGYPFVVRSAEDWTERMTRA